ncbi:hypothetical protein [Burkholderia gladioli]|nr:hypothetical protein [Burkholderia gladioli]
MLDGDPVDRHVEHQPQAEFAGLLDQPRERVAGVERGGQGFVRAIVVGHHARVAGAAGGVERADQHVIEAEPGDPLEPGGPGIERADQARVDEVEMRGESGCG